MAQRTAFIDWTENTCHIYTFEKQRNTCTFDGSASIDDLIRRTLRVGETLGADEIAQGLSTYYSQENIPPDQIYLSIPSSLLSIRELTFPFSEKEKINDTLPYELEGLLLGSVNDYAIDHIVTGAADSGNRVMAVCAGKTTLRDIIGQFSSAGLEPRLITSLDLRVSGGRSDLIIERTDAGSGEREEAARQEVIAPLINLRKDDLAYTGDTERMKKGLRLTLSLMLALLLLLSAHASVRFMSGVKEGRMIEEETRSVFRSVFPEDRNAADPAKQFRANLSTLSEKRSVLTGIPVLEILRDIAELRNGSITLHELTSDDRNIIMKGTALSFEQVDSFRNSLSTRYSGVKVLNSDSTADNRISFTLLMQERAL